MNTHNVLNMSPHSSVESITPELNELIKQRNLWQTKVAQAKKELIEKNMRLVFSIAKQYTNQGLNFMALIREGNVGLTEAVEKLELRKNVDFSSYATWCIRQSIARAISEGCEKGNDGSQKTSSALNQVTSEIKSELAYNVAPALHLETQRLQSTLSPKSATTKIARHDFPLPSHEELRRATQQILSSLPPREATVLKMRFGINVLNEYSIEEICDQVGITSKEIHQIEMKALRKLHALNTARGLKNCLNHEAVNA